MRRTKIHQTSDGQQWISSRELTENIFGSQRVTRSDESRRYFGTSVTPEMIELVLRLADAGYMRDRDDLVKETINFDPSFANCVTKRVRALASVQPKVVAADGDGVDKAKATDYAEMLRRQLDRIPDFRQAVMRLDWGHCNGRALLEKVWSEARGGLPYKYELRELNWIHTRRVSFGPLREFRIRDDAYYGGNFEARGLDVETIPHKFIPYRPQLFDDVQEREGYGPRAIYFSFFKRFGWRERMALMEVFGKPWRILNMAAGSAFTGPDQLDDMQRRADELGANASAAFAPGVELKLENPDPKSTDAHRFIAEDANDEIAKLVLGQTRTTSAKGDGLGGQQSLVHQDGETLVIAADGWGIGECLSRYLARDWVALNFGEEEAVNAPRIVLTYEASPDQSVEIERSTKFLATGLPVKTDELYRRCGFEKPAEGDEVVTQQSQPSAIPGAPAQATSSLSVVPAVEQTEGGQGEPAAPLASLTARSLRLSRLSSGHFSER